MKKTILLSLLLFFSGGFSWAMENDAESSSSGDESLQMGYISPNDTLLLLSAKNNKLALVKTALELGANINCGDNYGISPLMHAADHNCGDIVHYLLNQGANINQKDVGGWDALTYAVDGKYVDLVNYLLNHGAEITSDGFSDGQTLLALATNSAKIQDYAWARTYHTVKLLLDHGVKAINGEPLINTVVNKAYQIFELLLDYGVDVNLTNQNGETALMIAIKLGRTEMVNLLLQHNKNKNCINYKAVTNGGYSLLHYAFVAGDLVRWFVSFGLKFNDDADSWEFIKEVLMYATRNKEHLHNLLKILSYLYPERPEELQQVINVAFLYSVIKKSNVEAVKIFDHYGVNIEQTLKNEYNQDVSMLMLALTRLVFNPAATLQDFKNAQNVVHYLIEHYTEITQREYHCAFMNIEATIPAILSHQNAEYAPIVLQTHAENLKHCLKRMKNFSPCSDCSLELFLGYLRQIIELPNGALKKLLLTIVYELIEAHCMCDNLLVLKKLDSMNSTFIEELFTLIKEDQPEDCKQQFVELLNFMLHKIFERGDLDLNNNLYQKLSDQLNAYSEILRNDKKKRHAEAFKLAYLHNREMSSKRQKK